MGKISEFNQHDHEVIAREYADLKEAARKRCQDQYELDQIQKAFDFANEAHKGVRRRSGEPYILHPIAVAKIVVSNIGLGYKSIIAALLHDVVEDTDYTVTQNGQSFDVQIIDLKGILGIETGDSIVVDYTALLNTDAIIGLDGNENVVYLEYSNVPDSTGSTGETSLTGNTPEDATFASAV